MRNTAMLFLILANAFITIGLTGRRTFLFIGVAFLVVAFLRWRRQQR